IDQNLQHFLVGLGLLRTLEQVDVVLDTIFRLAGGSHHDTKVVFEEGLPFFIGDSLDTTAGGRQVGDVGQGKLIEVEHRSSNFLALVITEGLDDFIELAASSLVDDITDGAHDQTSFGAAVGKHHDNFISTRDGKIADHGRLFLGAADFLAVLVSDLSSLKVKFIALSNRHDKLLKYYNGWKCRWYFPSPALRDRCHYTGLCGRVKGSKAFVSMLLTPRVSKFDLNVSLKWMQPTRQTS